MSAYFISVFAICVCVGVLGLLSYDNTSASERVALGIILLYVVLSPLAETVKDNLGKEFDIDDFREGVKLDSGYSELCEAAICDGIVRSVATEFTLSEEDISVKIYGFDFEKMRADGVKVLLSGKAALYDSREVKKFIDEMGVGECEVEIRLGR